MWSGTRLHVASSLLFHSTLFFIYLQIQNVVILAKCCLSSLSRYRLWGTASQTSLAPLVRTWATVCMLITMSLCKLLIQYNLDLVLRWCRHRWQNRKLEIDPTLFFSLFSSSLTHPPYSGSWKRLIWGPQKDCGPKISHMTADSPVSLDRWDCYTHFCCEDAMRCLLGKHIFWETAQVSPQAYWRLSEIDNSSQTHCWWRDRNSLVIDQQCGWATEGSRDNASFVPFYSQNPTSIS